MKWPSTLRKEEAREKVRCYIGGAVEEGRPRGGFVLASGRDFGPAISVSWEDFSAIHEWNRGDPWNVSIYLSGSCASISMTAGHGGYCQLLLKVLRGAVSETGGGRMFCFGLWP